ncbi:Retrovirus-related Pol polyprotein from transposon opus [Eumeta japonica]|uniref:Retrovirus-related Pol polyprotein from transposon opus n=1 Tax=Eumeta variegata TaxID=151549 RepID=A0A4C1XM47_EUMVA|nr:Retrovirus-related Pol polyprotein from transposon opus [Eumeta japonica]
MNAIDTERIVRFIIEKFDGKNSSASRWMEVFEKNARFGIEEDAEKLRYSDKENFDYDFLVGLDCIKEFYLVQNENLEISQKIPIQRSEIVSKETNKTDIHSKEKKSDNLVNFNEDFSEENFKICINHLNHQEQIVIDELISKNKYVFAKDKYDIGMVTDYEAHIDLLTEKYCSKRPYRCTMEDKKEIENQIAKLLQKNIIEESYSPFAAPVTLAYKRDENKKSRLCIDFRDLNKIVVPQSQPFPLIEDLIVKTRDCKYFSTLDLNSAFWSIPLRITENKTAFVTQEGHYQWTCLPFGLKHPQLFSKELCNIIRKHKLAEFTINKRYLHLLSDHFTRYAYVLTSSTQNANDFIKLIRNCAETDDIELILSDQYPGINSKEFKRFLDERKLL